MGIFCTVSPESAKGWEIDTYKTAKPVETGRNDGAVSVLFAHIVSTRTSGAIVTDDAMDYPRDFRTSKPNKTGLGHLEEGRTVALHSLAVHPKLQGCGLGKLIMKSYMQQINNSGTANRISLIAQGVSFTHEQAPHSSELNTDPRVRSILSIIINDSASNTWARARPRMAEVAGMIW